MKKISLSILIFFTISINIYAQWQYKYYQTFHDREVLTHALFQEKFNTEHIDYPRLHAAIFFLTNLQRTKHKLERLVFSEELEIAAFNHSRMMGIQDFYSHINPKDKRRKTPKERAKLAGIKNPYIAENILYEYGYITHSDTYLSIAKRCVKNWMNSKGHRANLLSENGIALGCGTYFYKGKIYATQCFQWYHTVIKGERKDKLPLNLAQSSTNTF